MPIFRNFLLYLFFIFLLCSCGGRLHLEDALQNEAQRLDGSAIKQLITGQTVHFTSWDKADEADVIFNPDGSLQGRNNAGHQTGGAWQIKQNKLCLNYQKWGSGDQVCYTVLSLEDGYGLFRTDGGLDTSFTLSPDPASATEKDKTGWYKKIIPGLKPDKDDDSGETEVEEEREKTSWYKKIIPGRGNGKTREEQTGKAEDDDSWLQDMLPAWARKKAEPAPPTDPLVIHLLKEKECSGCNLAGKNLSGYNLKKVRLTGANLAGTDLKGSNLKGALLTGANLKGSDLEGADLKGADLARADLDKARLIDSRLSGANLAGASLVGANLHWADCRDANLTSADLSDSYLVKVDFAAAILDKASLTGATIQRCNFSDTKGYTPEPDQTEPAPSSSLKEKSTKSWWRIW